MTGRWREHGPQPRRRPADARRHGPGRPRTRCSSASTSTTTRRDVPGDGWHGVMNYAGFCKPAWTWLRQEPKDPRFLGRRRCPLPLLDAGRCVETMRDFTSRDRPGSRSCTPSTSSARTTPPRIRTLVGTPDGWSRPLPGCCSPSRHADAHLRRRDRHGGRLRRGRPPADAVGRERLGRRDCSRVYRGLIAARQGSRRAPARRPALGARRRATPWSSCARRRRDGPGPLSPAPRTSPVVLDTRHLTGIETGPSCLRCGAEASASGRVTWGASGPASTSGRGGPPT